MHNNKFFKILTTSVIILFSLVAVNAETVFEEERLCFQDEVPIHPGVPTRNGNRIDIKPDFIKDSQGGLSVYVSFDRKDCQAAHFESLDEETRDDLLRYVIAEEIIIYKYGRKIIVDEDFIRNATLDEKKEIIALSYKNSERSEHIKWKITGSLEPFSKKDRELTSSFLNKLKCLANLNFFTKENKEIKYDPEKHYKISICKTKPNRLLEFKNKSAVSVFVRKDKDKDTISQCLVLIDSYLQNEFEKTKDTPNLPKIGVVFRKHIHRLKTYHTHLIYHQISHALGISYPSYSSYEEYKKYPSISADEGDLLPVIEECLEDGVVKTIPDKYIAFLAEAHEQERLFKCINPQISPTSSDLKTLLHLHFHIGPSLDSSPECLKARKKFKEEHPENLKKCP